MCYPGENSLCVRVCMCVWVFFSSSPNENICVFVCVCVCVHMCGWEGGRLGKGGPNNKLLQQLFCSSIP